MTDTPGNGKKKNERLQLLNRQIKRVAAIETELLSCRQGALSHAWHLVQPDFDTGISGARAVAQQCRRCLTIKRYIVSVRYGEILSAASYEYPDGYTVKKDPEETGRVISSQAVRAEFSKRITPDMLEPMVIIHPNE